MSKTLVVLLALLLIACAPLLRAQDDSSPQPLSPDQLDNLLAPVALYPDPLLAQILLAATFPDQIDEAARVCRAGTSPDDIDMQPWDVSVKAVAHYPTVLDMMADNLDWTTALGQAYVNQTDDVMDSIQRLRQEARNAGNLATTPQQDVEVDDGYVDIWPAQAQYVYLPIYDPGLVFFGSGGVFGGPVITFGTGFPIGVWLNHGFDWRHRRIYYHGWSDRNGWVGRSRAYVHINNVYVNDNLKNVTANRNVITRRVNYSNLARYNSVHQNVTYDSRQVSAEVSQTAGAAGVSNKVIQRNDNVNDPRIDFYRGRPPDQPAAARSEPGRTETRDSERAGNPAFGGERSNLDVKAASQRGQSSRSAASHPAPAPRSSGGGGSHGGGGRH
ncbi:MAG TPA: DUF3300 domain-containing protein [Bryobacteraceae bacterium]|jgi:uncharacterized membrane protein YgcG|nr:DUF3300 domain-containing protein [Bryobacteraceae bacterium]